MNFVPLSNVTHYSTLEGLSKPDQLAKLCLENGYTSCGLTDNNSIAGAVQFHKIMSKAKVKPILGCTFRMEDLSRVSIFAQNKRGWENLIALASQSNNPENVLITREKEAIPRITFSMLEEFGDSLIAVTNSFAIQEFRNKLGKEKVYTANGKEDDGVAFPTSYYPCSKDAADHHILLCSLYGKSLSSLKDLQDDNAKFIKSGDYGLITKDELSRFTSTQLENTLRIADQCEEYKITHNPLLPQFPCPNGLTETEHLKKLCIVGWNKKLKAKGVFTTPQVEQTYRERVQKELGVITKAGLEGYFLIVADYVSFAKSKGWIVGPGRGSAAGSLVAYLMDITNVNPIKYDLIFERFYNEGRNTVDHISLPDIDVDFPIMHREEVIEYMRNRYGRDKVCQIITFGRMLGAGSVKEVLRAHEVCDAQQMNVITHDIPQEAAIADQLEADGEDSIINWTLDNEPDILKEYVVKNDKGELIGDYARYFEQAIRLEGTFRSKGKHAAGVVISRNALDKTCPMVYNGKDDKVAGLEMGDLEAIGLPKFDILGLAALDKLAAVRDLLRFGKIL